MSTADIENKIKQSKILIGYFSHDACSVCKVLRPQIEQLLPDFETVDFLYINTVDHPQVAGQHMVFAVPTIIVFADGREAKRFSRHLHIGELSAFLERII